MPKSSRVPDGPVVRRIPLELRQPTGTDHAADLANMALDIMNQVLSFTFVVKGKTRIGPENRLQLRIGINSGAVVGGLGT